METIRLERQWIIRETLARGGFGEVYLAEADDGSEAVVKLIPKTPGAGRELLFDSIPRLVPNVIPVLDQGEWDGQLVLVMPRAEKSLREHLQMEIQPSQEDAVRILADVADALRGLDGKVVHRDLKPENILFYRGRWVLTDFGIARYADASTAPDTRKYALTPPYAAPEQWRGEHVTGAADIYAFGVVAFELLQGCRPFPGPSHEDFRTQHLEHPVPPMHHVSPWLASLVGECLYKAPQARPTAANVCTRLERSQRIVSPAQQKLQSVQNAVVETRQVESARQSAEAQERARRDDLRQAAEASLNSILEALAERIFDAAPVAENSELPRGLQVELDSGVLKVGPTESAPVGVLARGGRGAPFDVVAFTAILVKQPREKYQQYDGRSHSLWFCDAQGSGFYRWYELAFMVNPFIREGFTVEPFAMSPTEEGAALAFAPVISSRQLDWSPEPIDQGKEDEFIDRWIGWFADAAQGILTRPQSMPERLGGDYRRAR